MKRKWNTWFLAVMLFGFMAGCGGGGSGSSSPTTSTATGYFIDSPVQGLTYASGGQSGTTDADGKFTYEVGKTVKFSVGAISLGEVSAKAKMTPVDMVANADASNTTVLKITRFLMTLDSDGNATNGITISDATKTAAQSASQINFSTATDADLTSALTPLTTKTLVSSSTAQTHLTSSVYGIYAGSYSGTYSGTSSGTWTVTIDSSGAITGTGTPSNSSAFSISGQVTTSGAATFSSSGSTSNGASFSGTIDASTGAMSGTWGNSSSTGSGSWTGTKQTTTTSTTTTTAPSSQVVNNQSTATFTTASIGSVSLASPSGMSYYCSGGCSSAFYGVSSGTNTISAGGTSYGTLGSFDSGKSYAVEIRDGGCAKLWIRTDTNPTFNNDTTKTFVSDNGKCGGTTSTTTTTTGVSQFDGTYRGSWSLTCPVCGDTAAGTFTTTLVNGVFTNTSLPITSGTHGIKFDSGTVSSSGAITGTGATPSQCSSSVSTFSGQITVTSTGGANMTITYSRTRSPEGCEAESGTITATR